MGSLGIESSKPEVVTIDVVAAKGLIQTTHVYLDVRTVEEFEKGHVDTVKMINIPYMFNTPEVELDVKGCQSGVRSLYATADLLAEGFKDVSNMGGGYVDWLKNEFPVKASLAKTEYEFPVKVEASLAKPSLDQL
ncbi:thiosulfate sulfurtransferase 18-like [Lotus japonicus]|uniref:thiosulfate sulfurtransferase 18-like n=1 Tax=Lotus japonicus TaxID=34305 RepID=UPI00258D4446|nr:thiosulfate sulfurtransferase 18-like [Lotus japonicus]